MKKILLCAVMSFFVNAMFAQSVSTEDTIIVDGTEYIPIEGRGATPNRLEGKWVLKSGAKQKKVDESLYEKKPSPGTEIKRESKTQVKTENGMVTTTTETEIERIAEPVGNQITPPQKNKLHRPERPNISFYGENLTFSGFTGCNKFSGRYTLNGNRIDLKTATPATQMQCIGKYDENDFLRKLDRVNGYKVSNGNLQLLRGNDVLLVFTRR